MPLLGPLVAYLPTPRGPEGEVRTDPLEELADRAVRAGVSGVALLGSTGGYPYLTAGARRALVAAAVAGRRRPGAPPDLACRHGRHTDPCGKIRGKLPAMPAPTRVLLHG